MTRVNASPAFARLQRVARSYSGRIAKIWAPPYDDFIAAPVQRRHLAYITAKRIGQGPGLDKAAFRHDVLRARERVFLARWAPGAPLGLTRAVAQAGETAWSPEGYRMLLAVLSLGGDGAKAIRHAKPLHQGLVMAIDLLPKALRLANVVRLASTPAQATVVRDAVRMVRELAGPEWRIDRLAQRAARVTSGQALYAAIMAELAETTLPAPFPETGRLRPLRTVEAVLDAGKRFQNCLSERVYDTLFNAAAIVEWTGEPRAVMQLSYEGGAGWVLTELALAKNVTPSAALRREIAGELEALGVRTAGSARFVAETLYRSLTG